LLYFNLGEGNLPERIAGVRVSTNLADLLARSSRRRTHRSQSSSS
jgi:hypothetical protein